MMLADSQAEGNGFMGIVMLLDSVWSNLLISAAMAMIVHLLARVDTNAGASARLEQQSQGGKHCHDS